MNGDNNSASNELKEVGRAVATIYGGKFGRFAYDAALRTKTGQNIVNNVSNGFGNINRTPFARPLQGIVNNEPIIHEDNIDIHSELDSYDNLLDQNELEEDVSNVKKGFDFSLFGNKDSKGSLLFGKKMTFKSKMKLYLIIGGACFVLFIMIFMTMFLDIYMDKFLNVLDWNLFSSYNTNQVDSDSDFSLQDSSIVQDNTLVSLIGEDAIVSIENNIKSVSNTCLGDAVSRSIISLIDGFINYLFKVPYEQNGVVNIGTIVDRAWGTRIENGLEVTKGLDNLGLLKWVYNNLSIINQINSVSDL